MKVFFAVVGKPEESVGILESFGIRNILEAYPRVEKTISKPAVRAYYSQCTTFIDSGGFSVQQGTSNISIDKYLEFLVKNKHLFTHYANLDPISSEETLKNYRKLQRAGLKPMPVYRQWDYKSATHRELLKEYCETTDYIAVGGIAKVAGRLIEGCDHYLDYVFQSTTKYKTKVHGFGVSTMSLLEKYPYYSIDQTGWYKGKRWGQTLVFDGIRIKTHRGLKGKDTTTIPMIKANNELVKCPVSDDQKVRYGIEAYLKMEKISH